MKNGICIYVIFVGDDSTCAGRYVTYRFYEYESLNEFILKQKLDSLYYKYMEKYHHKLYRSNYFYNVQMLYIW